MEVVMKNFLLIHNQEDPQQDGRVSKGQNDGIAAEAAESVQEGFRNGGEFDHLADAVGRDGVHSVDLEPVCALMPSAHVHQIIGQGDEEEADSAREKGHTAAPDLLDDREKRGDGQTGRNQGRTDHCHP